MSSSSEGQGAAQHKAQHITALLTELPGDGYAGAYGSCLSTSCPFGNKQSTTSAGGSTSQPCMLRRGHEMQTPMQAQQHLAQHPFTAPAHLRPLAVINPPDWPTIVITGGRTRQPPGPHPPPPPPTHPTSRNTLINAPDTSGSLTGPLPSSLAAASDSSSSSDDSAPADHETTKVSACAPHATSYSVCFTACSVTECVAVCRKTGSSLVQLHNAGTP